MPLWFWLWVAGTVLSLAGSWYFVLVVDKDEDRDDRIATAGMLTVLSILVPWLTLGAALITGIYWGFSALAGSAIDKADARSELKAERERLVKEAQKKDEDWMASRLKEVDRAWIEYQKELARG